MFLLKLIIRNSFRHKLRAILTIIGVAIAVLAFGLLRTLVGLWYLGAENSSATRLVTRNAISLVFSLPISYKDRIRQVPGVKSVSWGNWFGGIYIDEKHFFANYAVEPKSYLDLYPEFVLSPDQKKDFLLDRKGCRKTKESDSEVIPNRTKGTRITAVESRPGFADFLE